ncbi:aspartate carbamoyltransferase catalytic subunit [Abiotrophia defectiva]|uniref:Aspartate carbamoyltransferase n=1 Tax=Abiotrophia defectiva ATCC 49176 TaxID=592010 RepID=W1Q585_ABIDE|nr:aspartate carbamoyltransferase catalytic subunit [Abiotrophia defectiva]ESK66351.1 aspartate carbamoyltransferase [Abiotrophia defectiva ATCC 49176]QKH47814.1 aspartate carbamoyltransferase catalytic subunit [Abiotrophia defectiva]
MRNLVKMSDLSKEEVYDLIQRALELKAGASPIQRPDLIAANLFFENSTRTKHSFEVAQMKLGLQVLNFDASTSSLNKGETLYDTCKTLEAIGCNILVIRHSQEAYYQELEGLTIPIVSGGDGSGEHPSQCLLDLMTLYEHFGRIEGLEVVIAGDIKNSRVARSNYHMLTRLGAKVQFVGPQVFADPTLGQMVDFDQVIGQVDVCMLLRVQFERHQEQVSLSQADYHTRYGLTPARYRALKPQAIVMHPAPVNRDMEIASELVEAPQSRIFTQMTNGRYMRQAILEKIISDNAL